MTTTGQCVCRDQTDTGKGLEQGWGIAMQYKYPDQMFLEQNITLAFVVDDHEKIACTHDIIILLSWGKSYIVTSENSCFMRYEDILLMLKWNI